MKTKLFSIAMGLAVIAGPVGRAQEAAPADAGRKADHEALRDLRAKVVDALNRQDVEALLECVAEDFSYTSIDQTRLASPDALRKYVQRIFLAEDAPVLAMKIEAEAEGLTRFVSEDIGYCCGTAREYYKLRNGQAFAIPSRWTATVIRRDGQWKVLTVHSGVNALSNPVLSFAVRTGTRRAVVTLLAGLLLGIALSLLIRRLCNRRR